MSEIKDLTGKQFGAVTVLRRAGSTKQGQAKWLYRCICGKEKVAAGGDIRNGRITSCGCRASRKKGALATEHPLYSTWKNMKCRCFNPKTPEYKNYGGRGVTVCERWLDFWTFAADMGPKPGKKYSLDRINNDGDYCPENCKWSTYTEQSRNKGVRADSISGEKGISKRGNSFRVTIGTDGELKLVGTFHDIASARAARKEAERIYWGCAK